MQITALFMKVLHKSNCIILVCLLHASGKYFKHFINLNSCNSQRLRRSWAYITLLPITVRFYSNIVKFRIDCVVVAINKRQKRRRIWNRLRFRKLINGKKILIADTHCTIFVFGVLMCFCAGLYLEYKIFHRLNSQERIY